MWGRVKIKIIMEDMYFFMMFTVIKNGGRWDFFAYMLKVKGPTFEKMFFKFMETVGPALVTFIADEKSPETTSNDSNLTYACY